MVMNEISKFEEKVRRCEYLAEDELKLLCEFVSQFTKVFISESIAPTSNFMMMALHAQVKEILIEESNVQPVNSPVTVRSRSSTSPLSPQCAFFDVHA